MDIIKYYQQLLQLADAVFERIEHEDALVADVYKITKSDGTQLILKVCLLEKYYAREYYYLTFFAGKIPVPKIIQTIAPQATIPGAILMECLPGNVLRVEHMTDALTLTLGMMLARIHLNRTAYYGDPAQLSSGTSDQQLYFAHQFEENIDECRNHVPKDLLDACQQYYESHLNLLASADGPCIVHLDYRPGNIMVFEGKLQGIIDWSSARSGFAQADFVFMEHSVWQHNAASRDSFLSGYASVRPVPDYKDMMPLLRLNRALAVIGFLTKTNKIQAHDIFYQHNRQFIEAMFKASF